MLGRKQMRGPGAVFGTQQHGLSDLRFLAEVLKSPELLESARGEARMLVAAGADSLLAARNISVNSINTGIFASYKNRHARN